MKKICLFVIVCLFLSMSAQAEEDSAAITQGHFGFMAGGGQAGLGTDEVNDSSNIYAGLYAQTDSIGSSGISLRFTASWFNYVEEIDEEWSSSTINVNNYRILGGLSYQHDFANGWWMWNCFQVGTDWEDSKGFTPPVVLQEEFMFGSGFFYNFLIANARITDDDAYQSVYLADQMMFRLTKWFALGPETRFQWFNQWEEGEEDPSFVYEPSWGGLIRFGDNRLDQRWHVSVGYLYGDFMGNAWHADVWFKF